MSMNDLDLAVRLSALAEEVKKERATLQQEFPAQQTLFREGELNALGHMCEQLDNAAEGRWIRSYPGVRAALGSLVDTWKTWRKQADEDRVDGVDDGRFAALNRYLPLVESLLAE